MKIKRILTIVLTVFLLAVPMLTIVNAADYGHKIEEFYTIEEFIRLYGQEVYDKVMSGEYYIDENGDVYDLFGNRIPLISAAPSTGIDQTDMALGRAFNVIIFTLGISLASVGAVLGIKKFAARTK